MGAYTDPRVSGVDVGPCDHDCISRAGVCVGYVSRVCLYILWIIPATNILLLLLCGRAVSSNCVL